MTSAPVRSGGGDGDDTERGGQVTSGPGASNGVAIRVQTFRWFGAVCVVGAVLAADLVSKHWATTHLRSAVPSGGLVRLQLVVNRGASFGVGAGRPGLVLVSSLVATGGCLWWLVVVRGRAEQVAIAAVVGGALGNLVDRLVHGAVTDWIHLSVYPATFNIADIALRTGLVTALALGLRRSWAHPAR
ncbi:MAG: hypothetical protein NVS3B26_15370 [Mycobacteriales bacterium]